MAAEIDPVVLKFFAENQQFKAELRATTRTVDEQLGRQGARVRKLESEFSRSTSAIGGSLKTLAGSLAAAFTVRELAGLIDASKQIDAQLRLATKASGDFAKAQSDVRRIAAETRTEIGATAVLYANFQRNSVELGISQNEAARATETVTKAFRISGASAAEAAGGLRQFLQGIQSGTLRGEELNSVLENAPRLARLLADSLGVTIGELRRLGEEGELTADILTSALTDRRFTESIDAEFRELPVTFGEAMQGILNAATVAFGAFDEGGQFSKAILNFVTGGGDGLDDLADKAQNFGNTIRSEIDGLIAAIGPAISLFKDLAGAIEEASGSSSGFQLPPGLFVGPLGAIPLLRTLPAARQAREQSFQGRAPDEFSNRASRLAADSGLTIDGLLGRNQPRVRPVSGSSPRRSGGASSQRRAEVEARKAERERIDAIRDAAAFEREVAQVTQAIADAKAQLLVAAEDFARAEMARIDSERQRINREIEVDAEIGQLTAEQAQQLKDLNNQRADLQLELARRIAVEKGFRESEERRQRDLDVASGGRAVQAEILQGQADLADTQRQRLDIERRLIDLQFAEEKARNDYLIGYAERLRQLEGITESEIAEADAQAQIARLRNESLAQRQADAQQGANRQFASPLQRFAIDASDSDTLIEEAVVRRVQEINRTITDSFTNALGIKDPFLSELIRIFLDRNIFGPLAEALSGAEGGGGGGLGSAIGSILGGLFGRASGGRVNAGSIYRVNEGASPGRVEAFRPDVSGQIIPLGRMNAVQAGGQSGPGVAVVRLQLSGDLDARIESVSTGVAVEVVRQAAPSIRDSAVSETFRQANRPAL